jgi:hypothetical protein
MNYICNPLNIDYRYQFNLDQRTNSMQNCREAAEKGYERVGALVKGRNYYIRVDAFNECGITKGQVVKKV